MKSIILCYWGFGKYLQMNTKEFFRKIMFEKRENINVFWKGNKTKGGNKDAL